MLEQLTFKTGKEKAVSLEVKKSQITQNENPAGSKTQI